MYPNQQQYPHRHQPNHNYPPTNSHPMTMHPYQPHHQQQPPQQHHYYSPPPPQHQGMMMNNQPNYGQSQQPTYGHVSNIPTNHNNNVGVGVSGGSVTISTTEQHPHSFYYPYYSYQTTTNTNIPVQSNQLPSHQPQSYGIPSQPPMNPYGIPSQPPQIQTPPPVVNNPQLASVQTSITFSTTTAGSSTTPFHSRSIKYQINPPLHLAPHFSMRGELVLKTQHPFCVRSMHHSPTIIIGDSNTSKITLFDSLSGVVRESFDVTTGCIGGIGVDPVDDSFYVVSGKNIIKYGANGVHLGTFGQNLNLKNPYGLTVDDQGFVYICDLQQHIFVMSREGVMIRYISVDKPYDIFFDKLNQTLVVTDQQKDCVRVLTKDGQKIRKIGGKGNAKGQFCSPSGVCVNSSNGNIIVADYGNHRVQVFDCTGRFLYSMGNKGRLDSEFDLPRSVCTDINGNLFVVEYGNSRVQVFKKMP